MLDHDGYRIDLRLKGEMPALYVQEAFPTEDLIWSGILVAPVGVVCLYKPVSSSGG
jgi:hypothetical protein